VSPRRIAILFTAFAIVGVGSPRLTFADQPAPAAAVPVAVFVLDGSGDLTVTYDSLAVVAAGAPGVTVSRVRWTQGGVFRDLRGRGGHQDNGRLLADSIVTWRQANPQGRVCLVAHSAGAAVALAAAESLPAGSVDRIVLLAPAVSRDYPLGQALSCSREGIDCFYSNRDGVNLGVALAGSTDGRFLSVAGRSGFRSSQEGLRQFSHGGGHFACTTPDFVRSYLLPVLTPAAKGAAKSSEP
jgi:pimeloyl-ACP methyl ester carboxylesterase